MTRTGQMAVPNGSLMPGWDHREERDAVPNPKLLKSLVDKTRREKST